MIALQNHAGHSFNSDENANRNKGEVGCSARKKQTSTLKLSWLIKGLACSYLHLNLTQNVKLSHASHRCSEAVCR